MSMSPSRSKSPVGLVAGVAVQPEMVIASELFTVPSPLASPLGMPYGIPYGIPNGDANGDGTVNSSDAITISGWTATPATKPTGDFDLDGDIDIDDYLNAASTQNGVTMGWGMLSKAGGSGASANRKGYAGYEFDPITSYSLWHVRHRVY